MYGCNHNLSCLSGSVTKVSSGLNGEVLRFGDIPYGAVTKIGFGLKGYVSIVCSVSRVEYLRVAPNMVWLTPDILSSAEFEISSNIVWDIV